MVGRKEGEGDQVIDATTAKIQPSAMGVEGKRKRGGVRGGRRLAGDQTVPWGVGKVDRERGAAHPDPQSLDGWRRVPPAGPALKKSPVADGAATPRHATAHQPSHCVPAGCPTATCPRPRRPRRAARHFLPRYATGCRRRPLSPTADPWRPRSPAGVQANTVQPKPSVAATDTEPPAPSQRPLPSRFPAYG